MRKLIAPEFQQARRFTAADLEHPNGNVRVDCSAGGPEFGKLLSNLPKVRANERTLHHDGLDLSDNSAENVQK